MLNIGRQKDFGNGLFRDAQDFEHETSFETVWDQNKEAIAAHLGTTPEEME